MAVMKGGQIFGGLGLRVEENSMLCVKDPEAAVAHGGALLHASALDKKCSLSADSYRFSAKLRGDDLEAVENLVAVRLNKLADGRFHIAHLADVHDGLRDYESCGEGSETDCQD